MDPPLINATLTKVEATGPSEDYGVAAGPAVSRWTGSANAYLTEKDMTVVGGAGGELNLVIADRLVVPYDVGKLVKRNDSVTYAFDGTTFKHRVRDVQLYKLFGTARLWFYEET